MIMEQDWVKQEKSYHFIYLARDIFEERERGREREKMKILHNSSC